MRVIYNKFLPVRNFAAINLFGIIFARQEYGKLEKWELNHEKIHSYQILELFGIFYYPVYLIEWIIRLLQYKNMLEAYKNISFEREAYQNHYNLDYLKGRRPFSFINYYRRNKK